MKRIIVIIIGLLSGASNSLDSLQWPNYMPRIISLYNWTGKKLVLTVQVPCIHGGMFQGKTIVFDIAPRYDLQTFDLQAWFEKEIDDQALVKQCFEQREEELLWDRTTNHIIMGTRVALALGAVIALRWMAWQQWNSNQKTMYVGLAGGLAWFSGLMIHVAINRIKKFYFDIPAIMTIQVVDPSKTVCSTYLCDIFANHTCTLTDCVKVADKAVDTGAVEISLGLREQYRIKIIRGVLCITTSNDKMLTPAIPR